MTTETDQARVTDTVEPVVRLSEIRVVAEPPDYVTRGCRNLEQAAATLEAWARELQEFVRDHRSQDPVRVYVERETMKVCSHCRHEWETYDEDGKTLCAGCGREVKPNIPICVGSDGEKIR